jgi:bifunctional DNA-binding transcriptional regulator/antitoxin component of YhaV-PrlF toxin-antitoxin module
MSKRITTIDDASAVLLPQEAIDALGISVGGQLEIEIIGRAVVVRSVEEAERSRGFLSVFESVLKRRREAYEELAKGPE